MMNRFPRRATAFVLAASFASLAGAKEVVLHHPNGQVKESYTLVESLRQGRYASFYPKGQKLALGEYRNDLLEGQYLEYWLNGQAKLVATFKEGQLTGAYQQLHDNGQVAMQGEAYGCHYGNNHPYAPKRTGVWTKFHADGKKSSEGVFENDLMTGPWKDWHPTGAIAIECTMKEGVLTGTWSRFNEEGKLALQGTADGNLYHANFAGAPRRTGVWTAYHPNGKKASEGTYAKNNLDGAYTEWRADATTSLTATFSHGTLTGLWSAYDAAGKLARQGEAAGNRFHANSPWSPVRNGVWVTFTNRVMSKAELYERDKLVRELSFGTDPTTGISKVPYTKPDGTQGVLEVDQNGIRTPAKAPPTAADQPDLIAMSEDPATGTISTSRRNRDGSTSNYQGTASTAPDGSTRVIETDKDGNRVTTVYSNDGSMTVTHSRPGENEVTTTTTRDGAVTTVERRPTGETKTSNVSPDGTITHQIRDREGTLLRTVRETPDGWMEKTDTHGNTQRMRRAADGRITTVAVDRSGNTTTTVRDKTGAVVEQTADIVAPPEPGRAYFEQVLKGDDWDDLPASLKNRYAASERLRRELQDRHPQREAAAARDREEKLRAELVNAGITAEGQRKLDALEAERIAAEKLAKARRDRVARQEEVANVFAASRSLQAQYDAAIARGDKQEAQRIMALQDTLSERSVAILEPTPDEAAEMQRATDLQSRVAREITSRAHEAANARIDADASLQDTKDDVTTVTRFLSTGSQMQRETSRTTRGANRERVLAEAKLEAIDARLEDPRTTDEEKDILRGLRESAQLQSSGATEMLAANERLTLAGYAADCALVLTGGKIVQGGAKVARTAVTAARNTLAGRTAGMAGRTTVNLSAEAGGALSSTSRMSASELAAMREARTASDISQIVGSDILTAGAGPPRISTSLTRAQLAQLHMPGANLTRAQIMVKAEIYRLFSATKIAVSEAIADGADQAVIRSLQSRVDHLAKLLDEAKAAGQLAYQNGL